MDAAFIKISVVTVCRNAESCIRETIESILQQDYRQYEYIIIDGASGDHTLEIADGFSKRFQDKKIGYRIVSEPDKGIYDAMNKSLNYAKGEWIFFLNAGDTFFNETVLSRLFHENYDEFDVVYGNVVLYENNHYKLTYVGTMEELRDKSPICHQGVIVKTDLLRQYRFCVKYRLAADYDLLLRFYQDGKKFKKIDLIFSVFPLGGLSSKQSYKYLREMDASRHEHGIKCSPLWVQNVRLWMFNVLRDFGRYVLKPIFYSEKRGWYSNPKSFL